mmetsp:Transcript_21610/g.85899  ORF Transcript_21610/g.85899 Transcript_21610/m.85899 type:complete len:262 (+) Transcript_21610:1358-2143(+)
MLSLGSSVNCLSAAYRAAFLSATASDMSACSPRTANSAAADTPTSCGMPRAVSRPATSATLSASEARTNDVEILFCAATRVNAASFSSDLTRILSVPCSIERIVSSRYLILRGVVMAVLMSLKLSPVASAASENDDRSESMSRSTKGCASFERSYLGSRPLPMPSIEAIARKMNVKVDGKRNTCASVSDCNSAPSVVLMFLPFLPSCASLKVRMKNLASCSTAMRSAPRAKTPISSTASTSSFARAESWSSDTYGPPSKSA